MNVRAFKLVLLAASAATFASCASYNIFTAAVLGRNDMIIQHLERGTPVDLRFAGKGETALMFAAEEGRLESVKLLLDRGADPLLTDRSGRTALDRTRRMRRPNPDVIALLTRVMAARQPRPDTSPSRLAVQPAPVEPVSDVDAPPTSSPERPDDFALVIGIENYQTVPRADYGERDARTVKKHLLAQGFPARNLIALEGPQATGNKLKSYLEEWLPRNLKPASTLFVYYSGHGAPDPVSGDAYLVPWDGDPKFLKTTALPLKSLYAKLAALPAKRVVVALDACFSGAGGRSVLPKGARPLVAKVADALPVSDKLVVLAAASGDEITGSLDEQGHGMFTYHLLKGLSSGAKSPRALFDYLRPRVQDDARRQNREQTPVLTGADPDSPL